MSIDQYSWATSPIKMLFRETPLGDGTCFFYKKNGKCYLVTNWHVLSGRDVITGQPRKSSGAVPDSISISFHVVRPIGAVLENYLLNLNSANGEAIWLQHSIHGQDVDIAVLELTIPSGLCVYPINEMDTANIRAEVGINLYILGYPVRQFTGIFPVWKRGTLATEFIFPIEGKSCFLIDTATQEGMSGSPVILRENNYIDDISNQGKISMPAGKKFIGIYSGRYNSNDQQLAQLGIVWKKELIDEIIDSGVAGNFVLKDCPA